MKKEYNTYVLIGMQSGDEGKSKIVNYYAEDAQYLVKFQNSNYVTHSHLINNEKITLNILPSAILSTDAKCILASSSLIDIEAFLDEVYKIEKHDIILSNLYIDGRANIIMPYHVLLDNIISKITLSKIGVESCYEDKISGKGLRISDMLNLEKFSMKLSKIIQEKNQRILQYTQDQFDFNHIYERYKEFSDKLRYRIIDSMLDINNAIDSGQKVVFEGSESVMNDIEFGTYPYVSPTNSTIGSVCSGTGIAPNKITNVIGIFKAYTTNILNNSGIATRINDIEIEKHIIEKGREYDGNTPKICGWLDLAVLRYGCIINGITQLAITKLDVLTGIEKIKIAVAYEIDSQVTEVYRYDYEIQENKDVLYKEFDGWTQDISDITNYDDLPENCKRILEYIEGYLDVKISLISVGNEKNQIIIR